VSAWDAQAEKMKRHAKGVTQIAFFNRLIKKANNS